MIFQPIELIKYVSSLCGSGKTYSAIRFLSSLLPGHSPYIYSAPTTELCNQVYDDLSALGVECKVIHSDTRLVNKSVSQEILEYLKSDIRNKILICTHDGLNRLPIVPQKSITTLIMDEARQIDTYHRFELPYNKTNLTDCVDENWSRMPSQFDHCNWRLNRPTPEAHPR